MGKKEEEGKVRRRGGTPLAAHAVLPACVTAFLLAHRGRVELPAFFATILLFCDRFSVVNPVGSFSSCTSFGSLVWFHPSFRRTASDMISILRKQPNRLDYILYVQH